MFGQDVDGIAERHVQVELPLVHSVGSSRATKLHRIEDDYVVGVGECMTVEAPSA